MVELGSFVFEPNFFQERSQALNCRLQEVDGFVQYIHFGLSFGAVRFECVVQFVAVLPSVTDRHFRREFATGVVGEALFAAA